MHRNTLLLVSILAVIAALLVGIRLGMKMQTPTAIVPTPTISVSPTIQPTPSISYKTYVDEACELSVQYPSSLEVLESTNSGTILADSQNPDTSIIIVCQQDIPRVPLTQDKIESISLTTPTGASVSAKLYHDGSAKDGTPVDKLIFTHPTTGMDVFIGGFGTTYQQIISSLKLL